MIGSQFTNTKFTNNLMCHVLMYIGNFLITKKYIVTEIRAINKEMKNKRL